MNCTLKFLNGLFGDDNKVTTFIVPNCFKNNQVNIKYEINRMILKLTFIYRRNIPTINCRKDLFFNNV